MARCRRLTPARFHEPPFRPCVRFSREPVLAETYNPIFAQISYSMEARVPPSDCQKPAGTAPRVAPGCQTGTTSRPAATGRVVGQVCAKSGHFRQGLKFGTNKQQAPITTANRATEHPQRRRGANPVPDAFSLTGRDILTPTRAARSRIESSGWDRAAWHGGQHE